MKQAALFLLVILLATGCGLFRSPVEYNSPAAQLAYIQKYKDVAIAEMNRSGIPASIIMAQALLESGSGLSELSQKANNHFGIKCTRQWTGATFRKKDDDRDSTGSLVESCFRRYNNVAESYADHGDFIRDPRSSYRYGFLFNLDRTDYKSWARGLQSAGYATSTEYSNRLIALIERLQLYQYDRPGNRRRGSGQPERPNMLPGNNGNPGGPVEVAALDTSNRPESSARTKAEREEAVRKLLGNWNGGVGGIETGEHAPRHEHRTEALWDKVCGERGHARRAARMDASR